MRYIVRIKELIGDQVDMGTFGLVELELVEMEKELKQIKNHGDIGAVMPRTLTAENGAKALLIGEFHEYYEFHDEECGEQTVDIPVQWTTIKEIYKKIVAHYGA